MSSMPRTLHLVRSINGHFLSLPLRPSSFFNFESRREEEGRRGDGTKNLNKHAPHNYKIPTQCYHTATDTTICLETYLCIDYQSRITPRVHERDAAEMNGSTSSSARCRRLRALFQFPAYLLLLALSSDFTAISGHSILVALGLFDGERRSTRRLAATCTLTPPSYRLHAEPCPSQSDF